ncbi:hypothetical protein [Treponema vincentii]|uniref:hypothetical protein n=1 Tax=Treponema vincentii TaxID=69710 RepID=UPI001E5248E1|nr:hypothetical protein [Treponema vincentii]
MNSRVKQAQRKEPPSATFRRAFVFGDKNALFKVIKLKYSYYRRKVIVQGGTFHNDAVLRAFELITGKEAVRPTSAA